MSAVPYMKFYIGDYLGDTQHLTALQHGAYLLLIMAYWQRRGPLPNDDDKLARIARCTSAEWERCKSDVLAFFEEREGVLYHHRIDRELDGVAEVSEKRKSAAHRKWDSSAQPNASAMQVQCKTDANAMQMDSKCNANAMLSHIHIPYSDSELDSIPKEEKKAGKPPKHKLGEFSNVFLTDAQEARLVSELGKNFFARLLTFYSAWKEEKGSKTKDDNLTIRRWVIDAVRERDAKHPPKPEVVGRSDAWGPEKQAEHARALEDRTPPTEAELAEVEAMKRKALGSKGGLLVNALLGKPRLDSS
jgi:uncharacterized protein YdaU (DUF1376 family)